MSPGIWKPSQILSSSCFPISVLVYVISNLVHKVSGKVHAATREKTGILQVNTTIASAEKVGVNKTQLALHQLSGLHGDNKKPGSIVYFSR